MAEVSRIKYREMAEKPIARTFKGILRLAHVQEAADKEEDYYFNPIYHATPSKGIASESTGYDSAFNGLSGSLLRYTFPDDNYKNAKLPVTDSLGNYMNINLGADGVTFGSDELNNGNNADKVNFTQLLYNKQFSQEKVFPVIEAQHAIIGLKGIELPESKSSVNNGTLSIDSSPYYDNVKAQIIVKNNYDHTPSHIENDGKTYKKLNEADKEYTYRTIYQITNDNLQDYDALVHFQDNIDEHNLKTNKTIDSFVDVINLKEYVKDKLTQYLKGNIVEVPTGTIINQYIDLKKWYCIGNNSGTGSLGNNPPMGIIQDADNYTPTLYQGLVRKGINRLVALSDEEGEDGSYGPKQLKEIIPLYKRDYALADGAVYTIHMLLPGMSNNYDYQSYEQFINLFFCIGYQYTSFKNIRDHYAIQKNGEKYTFGNQRTVSTLCQDPDVLFSVDFLSILAIKAIYNEMKNGVDDGGKSACLNHETNMFDRDKAEEWLKKQSIPREYIFNSMVPHAQGGMQYEYTVSSEALDTPPTYKFDIGLEVNSFSSKIWYFDPTVINHDHDNLHGGVQRGGYVVCEAWQTAEVQSVLDMFAKINLARERELKNYFTFTFQVPNLVQDISEKYKTGAYIGYSPFNWTVQNMHDTGLESVSTCSSTSHPHRHAVCMGPLEFKGIPDVQYQTGELTSTAMTRTESVERWIGNTEETAQPFEANAWNINAYTFAEVAGLSYHTEIHDGMAVKVIQMENVTGLDQLDPRWKNAEPNRGITSPPIDMGIIDEKFRSASANTADGEIKWFAPECIQMVPLIKL